MAYGRYGRRRYGGYRRGGYGGYRRGGARRPFRRSSAYGTWTPKTPQEILGSQQLRMKKAYFRRAFNASMAAPGWGNTSPQDSWGAALTGTGDYDWKEGSSPSWGARAGAWAGDRIGSWIGGITGLGDYNIKSNTLMAGGVPKIQNGANIRELLVSHTEYIGDVVSSDVPGEFALSNFFLNPGNSSCFPWLSQLAACFQQYKFQGLVFFFKTMSGDALTSDNTALGQVIMGTNYNVTQPNFDDSFEMINTEFSSVCKPSCSLAHGIECAPSDTPVDELYITTNGVIPEGATPQFYNFANFQIATAGLQGASVNVGQLHVSYQVALLKPILPEAAGNAGVMSFAHYCQVGGVASVTESLRTFIDNMMMLSTGQAPQQVSYASPSLPLGFLGVGATGRVFIGGGTNVSGTPPPFKPRIGTRYLVQVSYSIPSDATVGDPIIMTLPADGGLRMLSGWNSGAAPVGQLDTTSMKGDTARTVTGNWILEVVNYSTGLDGTEDRNPYFDIDESDKPGQLEAPPSSPLLCAMDLYVIEMPADSFPNFAP